MAEPNIISVSSILGRTRTATLSTTSTTIYTCPANKVIKVNSIIVANRTGSTSRDATIIFYDSVRPGGVAGEYYLAYTVPVLPDSTLIVLSKESPIYMEEGDQIRGLATAASSLDIIISFEEIG